MQITRYPIASNRLLLHVHLYKLDNKIQDRDFLENKVVKCKAFFTINEFLKHPIVTHDKIVVSLSNGKKYSATVASIEVTSTADAYEAMLLVQRRAE